MKCLEKDRTRRYETAGELARRHRALPARRAGRGLAAVAAVSPREVRGRHRGTDRHGRGICPARRGGSRREHLASHAGPRSRTPGARRAGRRGRAAPAGETVGGAGQRRAQVLPGQGALGRPAEGPGGRAEPRRDGPRGARPCGARDRHGVRRRAPRRRRRSETPSA